VIRTLVPILFQNGVNVDSILPKEEGQKLEQLIIEKKFSEVCPKLDEVLKKFGTAIKEKHIELNNLQMAAPVMEAPPDEAHIKKILEEIKKSPTNSGNVEERFHALMEWIHMLLQEGTNISCVLPRKKGEDLEKLFVEKKFDMLCPEIDKIFKGLEELVKSNLLPVKVNMSVKSDKVEIIKALPSGEKGVDIGENPEFSKITSNVKNGIVQIELSDEPVWIIEGNLPAAKNLSQEKSPFGFHPADAGEEGYKYARDIGVTWDRGGLYFFWVLVQPDLKKKNYDWSKYDSYFQHLPCGFQTLKNITVCPDGAVKNSARHPFPSGKNPPPALDVSQHLEGVTYRPADRLSYSEWVQAAVERYDGDGIGDMPGLSVPAKYWQVDNEPPRGREGYADLVHITSKAIKKADHSAKVLIGGLILPAGYMVKAYERESLPLIKELAGKDIDIFDFHWFGSAGEWQNLPEAMKRIRKDLKEAGFEGAPVWFAEMGTSSGTPAHARCQTEREQACEMVKRYSVALGEGVGKIFWAWGMREGFMDVEDNDFFDNTGFVYDGIGPDDPGKGVKKVIYWTYKNMTQLLQYWDGSLPERIKSEEGVWAYRFRFKGEARGIIIAWHK